MFELPLTESSLIIPPFKPLISFSSPLTESGETKDSVTPTSLCLIKMASKSIFCLFLLKASNAFTASLVLLFAASQGTDSGKILAEKRLASISEKGFYPIFCNINNNTNDINI